MDLDVVGSGMPFLVVAVAILVNIFWMIVGWRAMRAHERVAAALRSLADSQDRRGNS